MLSRTMHNSLDIVGSLTTLGWSQQQLADRLGVHRNTVGNWIKRQDMPGWAAAYIALALGIRETGEQIGRMLR